MMYFTREQQGKIASLLHKVFFSSNNYQQVGLELLDENKVKQLDLNYLLLEFYKRYSIDTINRCTPDVKTFIEGQKEVLFYYMIEALQQKKEKSIEKFHEMIGKLMDYIKSCPSTILKVEASRMLILMKFYNPKYTSEQDFPKIILTALKYIICAYKFQLDTLELPLDLLSYVYEKEAGWIENVMFINAANPQIKVQLNRLAEIIRQYAEIRNYPDLKTLKPLLESKYIEKCTDWEKYDELLISCDEYTLAFKQPYLWTSAETEKKRKDGLNLNNEISKEIAAATIQAPIKLNENAQRITEQANKKVTVDIAVRIEDKTVIFIAPTAKAAEGLFAELQKYSSQQLSYIFPEGLFLGNINEEINTHKFTFSVDRKKYDDYIKDYLNQTYIKSATTTNPFKFSFDPELTAIYVKITYDQKSKKFTCRFQSQPEATRFLIELALLGIKDHIIKKQEADTFIIELFEAGYTIINKTGSELNNVESQFPGLYALFITLNCAKLDTACNIFLCVFNIPDKDLPNQSLHAFPQKLTPVSNTLTESDIIIKSVANTAIESVEITIKKNLAGEILLITPSETSAQQLISCIKMVNENEQDKAKLEMRVNSYKNIVPTNIGNKYIISLESVDYEAISQGLPHYIKNLPLNASEITQKETELTFYPPPKTHANLPEQTSSFAPRF